MSMPQTRGGVEERWENTLAIDSALLCVGAGIGATYRPNAT